VEDNMAEGGFDFQKFIEDSKNVLMNPKDYFASMPKEGGFGEPLIKAVIYGGIAGLIGMIWSIIGISAVGGGALGGMIGGGVGVMVLVWGLIGALIGLFLGGVIVLVISAICGGETNYEVCVRVTASMMVLSPISALFGFASGIHYSIGSFVTLAVSLYSLFLLYNAVVHALGGKEGTAKIVSIILAVIPALMLVSALMCANAVTSSADKWMKQSEDLRKDLEKGDSSEAMKKLNDAFKKMEEASKEAE